MEARLNMAEIELAVLTRQCLQRRLATPELMRKAGSELAAGAQSSESDQPSIGVLPRLTLVSSSRSFILHLKCDSLLLLCQGSIDDRRRKNSLGTKSCKGVLYESAQKHL